MIGISVLAISNPWNFSRAAEVHVSPSGSDAAAGTGDAPYATVGRAFDALRGQPGPHTVWLEPGTYPVAKTLTLTNSGVTLRATRDREAVLDAGVRPAASNWIASADPRLPEAAQGKVLELDVKAAGLAPLKSWPEHFSGGAGLVQILDAGERLALARWPEAGDAFMAEVLDKGDERGGKGSRGGSFVYHEDAPSAWTNAAAGGRLWLEGEWYAPWRVEVLRVAEVDPSRRAMTFAQGISAGIGSKYTPAGEKGLGNEPWHALNLIEALDRPGEWCADFAAQKLFVWPRGPATNLAVLQLAQPLLQIRDATNVTLRGIVLEGGLGTAVEIKGGAECTIEACEIRRQGDNGVSVAGGFRHRVLSCDLHDLGGAGVSLNGGDRKTLTPSGHVVDNCLIERFGRVRQTYAPGVSIANSAVGCTVTHCRIHDAPHAGLLYGGNDHLIALNEIYDVVNESDDMGATYSCHDWTSFGNVLRNNFIHHAIRATGCYLDDGDSGDTIEGNVFYRVATGPFIGGGHHNLVRGNLSIACLRGAHLDARGVDRGYGTEAGLFKQLDDVKVGQPPWSARYPVLQTLAQDDPARPRGSVIESNAIVACEKAVNLSFRSNQLERCRITNNPVLAMADMAFADPANLNFELGSGSAVFKALPGFAPIPFAEIGLRTNEFRSSLPAREAVFSRGRVAAAGDTNALTPTLFLTSPAFQQVFQRDSKGTARVVVEGRAGAGVEEIRFRVTGRPLKGALPDAWTTVVIDSATRTFRCERVLPAGGWYRMELHGYELGRRVVSWYVDRFGVGEVFVVAGQSNAGNHGSEKTQTATRRVSAFDGKQWHLANDPQRGASGSGGSFMPAFGDALVNKLGVPVAVVPVAAGGTSVREWLPAGTRMTNQPTTGKNVKKVGTNEWAATGTLFANLAARLQQLGSNGCRAVLWHQGESDAGQARGGYPADRQITGAQYAAFMEQLIRASRQKAGWDVPWMTALATYHGEQDAADEEFRAAQKSLWAAGLAWEGPDTDALGGPLRAGVHFNAAGLKAHGELWAAKVADRIGAKP